VILCLHISELAQRDILDIATYLALERPDSASRFIERTWETGAWLTSTPQAGRRLRTRLPRLAGLRK
jgi:plasmid stabilization system protein ParE